MATLEIKKFDSPDETRPFADKGKAEVVNLGGSTRSRDVRARLALVRSRETDRWH